MVELFVAAGIAVVTLVIGGASGFFAGRQTGGSDDNNSDDLQMVAEQLNQPAEPQMMTDAIGSLVGAIDSVVDATDLEERDILRPDDGPIKRADELQRTAERNGLIQTDQQIQPDQMSAGSMSGTDFEDEKERDVSVPLALTSAVETVQSRTSAETPTGQRLLDYLETVDETPERHLTETLDSVVETLNKYAAVESILEAVEPHAEPHELARRFERENAGAQGEVINSFNTIAKILSATVEAHERCESERKELVKNAERVCTAADTQTTITFDNAAETEVWLASLADRLDNGSVSFTDRENSIRNISKQLKLTPESALGREFVDILTNDVVSRQDCENTLQSVVSTIDQAETTNHRLNGINREEVARLARRVADEFSDVNTSVGSVLRERAVELESTVKQAGETDLMTVYAARQELRFYDHQLLKQVQAGGDTTGAGEKIRSLTDRVEQRRTTMRTQYPSDYPQHDHSIPIHFLELVSSLQEAASDARASGNNNRAIGYLKAADQTLDWVAELYERQAYSVLLEQLRG